MYIFQGFTKFPSKFGLACLCALWCFFSVNTASAQSDQIPSEYLVALERVRQNPSDPEASFRLAQVAAQTGDFQTAISAFERILILNPTLSNIKLELGVLYLRQGASELAEKFISEALESPDAPPAVRERAEELLALAEDSNSRWRFFGSVTAGLIADTNANAGPDNGTEVRGFVVLPEFTDQSDVSAFLGFDGRVRYDMGFQAGHLFALDLDAFGRAYRDQSQLNLARGAVAPGFDFNLTPSLNFPSEITLRYSASLLNRDGERYVDENGWVTTFRATPNIQNRFELTAFTFDQNYHATTLDPSNDNRDGRRNGLTFRYSRLLNERTGLNVILAYANKTADVGFEAYDDSGIFVEVLREIPPWFGEATTSWKYSVGLGYGQRDYDSPDAAIDPTSSQSDERFVARAALFIPLWENAEFQAEIGHFDQNSNYELDTFDNTYLALSVTRSF